MAITCREAIKEIFNNADEIMTKDEVIRRIYEKYPTRPWKRNTITLHLAGLSINHPQNKHHPNLKKHAFLFYLGSGLYRLTKDSENDVDNKKGVDFINAAPSLNIIEDEDFDISNNSVKEEGLNENNWMTHVLELVNKYLPNYDKLLVARQGAQIPYASEIISYSGATPNNYHIVSYETDLLILEKLNLHEWKPRLIIEGKINSVTTHDAITYSQKALSHKNIHPYLRYGILLGNRQHHPLPGRLFRHGAYFDFMLSWKGLEPLDAELECLISIIVEEVAASRSLDDILFNSRNPNRAKYTLLHRSLILK